jgi:uncharacterized spore protein YtfJ
MTIIISSGVGVGVGVGEGDGDGDGDGEGDGDGDGDGEGEGPGCEVKYHNPAAMIITATTIAICVLRFSIRIFSIPIFS